MLAESIKESFNRRFWNEQAGFCFDVDADRGDSAQEQVGMSAPCVTTRKTADRVRWQDLGICRPQKIQPR
jgi:glycogen debranching enzyme